MEKVIFTYDTFQNSKENLMLYNGETNILKGHPPETTFLNNPCSVRSHWSLCGAKGNISGVVSHQLPRHEAYLWKVKCFMFI